MTTGTLNSPTKVIFERAESSSYETDANGCVVCPNSTPEGPTCDDGYEKLLRSPTCSQCAEYYCGKISGGSGKSTPVGAIVGGIIGGLVAIIVAGLLYYFLVWKKKHPSLDDEEDINMSDLENEDKGSFSNESNMDNSHGGVNSNINHSNGNLSNNSNHGTPQLRESELRPPNRRNNSSGNIANRRLSSYESFTRPQKVNARGKGRKVGKRQLKSQNLINNANINYGNGQFNSPYLDPNSSNRNSIATTISTTNASNILPIAYIPGVTVRPTKNNTKSIYSYETDSIFSDLNTIENASIIGDIMRANYQDPESGNNSTGTINGHNNGNNNGKNNDGKTMTAIKAQPRLVNVDRIDEEDEEDEFYELSDVESNTYSINHASRHEDKKTGVITTTNHLNDSTLSNITQIAEEDSDDSDVDSDIGEIQRATSIRRNEQQVRQVEKEIPLDLIDLGKPTRDNESVIDSNGSFVLDVEIDKRDSTTSGERSPFEDPQ